MNIILIGMKSSGKSSIGKTISVMMDREFFDTDEILKTLFFEKYKKKKTIFEIFQFLEEKKFRCLENEIFVSFKNVKNAVISTGGGSILDKKNILGFENPKIIVYLKSSIETLKKRIQKEENPTQFKDENILIKTFESRKKLYENVSDITIPTDDSDIEKIAFEIKNKIAQKNHLKTLKNI